MTEGRDGKAVDMFGRQALLGNRVPVLWNLNKNLLDIYHKHCDADVGSLGTGELGIPVTLDENHAKHYRMLHSIICVTQNMATCVTTTGTGPIAG
jgi:hypothetical protein